MRALFCGQREHNHKEQGPHSTLRNVLKRRSTYKHKDFSLQIFLSRAQIFQKIWFPAIHMHHV